MALNSSKRNEITNRRRRVAHYRLQGHSERWIAETLKVSLGTVNADIKANDARWRQAADVDTATLRARQLAEIAAIKQKAWTQYQDGATWRVLLQAIRLEAQITGTLAPPTLNFNVNVMMPIIEAIQRSGVPPEQAGEAFAAWFRDYAAERQQQEQAQGVLLENGD